ncbi:MAG: hypothetical protein A2445_01470 [Candidatus Jacksonbacteria bacterium RIFOXYC2_FULL_44_29]|nr:MAG: hypothetical protein UR94_C0005G0019 [Parcubacteria group bacterium GW2011_GWA2_36_10]KKT54134.1 MAG: hypothetical protein UW45_C0018G0020 [Parcubacteria group bacterium GW2011_GWC2_44_22]OGY75393.1 MAG: hypothetical protein A2295_05950 [Candidatus Jacksonbacteria bacterium RIFOXYB2_FULL_44_15]OGY76930.1 MAG: hypothetical protein A2240_01855 [Candidatus Jacksonbacteria bacterium RIFOXYA2_FULL_43_12]OGY77463.1 MAG: hypothetical protein A2445_01470 [Candidatus Jacksonbacteria bacterium RI
MIIGFIPNFLGLYFLDIKFYSYIMDRPLILLNIVFLFVVLIALIKNPNRFVWQVIFISSVTMIVLLTLKLVTSFLTEQGYGDGGLFF